MTTNDRLPKPARTMGVILLAALLGPLIGFLIAGLDLVLAPPWTSLSGMIYPLLIGLGLPVALAARMKGWIGLRGLIAALVLTGVVGCFYLALLNPVRIPAGMTACQPLAAPAPQVRYHCVSTSSDNPDYRQEFIIQGRAGWPVMRIVEGGE